MLGVAIGLVSSIVLFVFYPYDRQAVNKHKEERKKQREEKQRQKEEREAKIKQQKEKIANDPALKKKQQQSEKKMKSRLFEGLSDKDRKLLEQYMDEKRKKGKTDAEIIKDATNKAGMFMIFTFVLVVVLVMLLVFVYKGGNVDLEEALAVVFPRFGSQQAAATSNSDL